MSIQVMPQAEAAASLDPTAPRNWRCLFRGYFRGAPDALVADNVVTSAQRVNGFLSQCESWELVLAIRSQSNHHCTHPMEPVDVLGRDQDRLVRRCRRDEPPERVPPDRVQPGGRLVERAER